MKKNSLLKNLKRDKTLIIMFLPVLIYYIVFQYVPMTGIVLAFKDFSPRFGIWGSEWVGLKHFVKFFSSPNFSRIFFNTLRISISSLVCGFPAPIILALLLNEVKGRIFKRSVQTITYLPHFISLVVAVGLVIDFTKRTGIINAITAMFGAEPVAFMSESSMFTPIYVISGIWQEIGWGSIIYLSALSGISPELYEAADIDGAGRWKKMFYVTLPGIAPTIIILFLLNVGKIMSIGYEKIILLGNDLVWDKAEIISSYVYKMAFGTATDYGYSTAISLFNTVINLILLISANKIADKVGEVSLW